MCWLVRVFAGRCGASSVVAWVTVGIYHEVKLVNSSVVEVVIAYGIGVLRLLVGIRDLLFVHVLSNSEAIVIYFFFLSIC